MGPRCSSAETQVCHRSYIIAARGPSTEHIWANAQHKKHTFEGGPSTEHPWTNALHKNITLKEDNLQNTSGLMFHTKKKLGRRTIHGTPLRKCSTQKHNSERGPSTEHIWTNSWHKNITLKEDHLQNTSGIMLHTKT